MSLSSKVSFIISFEPAMIRIPAGTFLMGTKPKDLDELYSLMKKEKKGMAYEQRLRESPQFNLELLSFEISQFPITNREYSFFVLDTKYPSPLHWQNNEVPKEIIEHPVVNITWRDACAYCKWLSEKTNKEYWLPSEAEWEKAARGTDGRRYPWGNNWNPNLCNNIENGLNTTTPVGHFSPKGDSPYGCADMIGNVWEWCSSRYGGIGILPNFLYPYNALDGREDINVEDSHILRGGSFLNGSGRARCEYRGKGDMIHKNNHTGFRCVKNVV
jgi:toxoflavin biosynthesis protein ToxD